MLTQVSTSSCSIGYIGVEPILLQNERRLQVRKG